MAKKMRTTKKRTATKAPPRLRAKRVTTVRKMKPKPMPMPTPTPVPVKVPGAQKGYGKAELAHFKEIILEKRKEILEELEALKSTMMDVQTGEYVTENSTYSLHMEQGTDTMEREKTFLFASREGRFLNYLDDALKRIEKGEYGFCTDCGNLIDKERLEAVPHAQLCIKCKLKRGK